MASADHILSSYYREALREFVREQVELHKGPVNLALLKCRCDPMSSADFDEPVLAIIEPKGSGAGLHKFLESVRQMVKTARADWVAHIYPTFHMGVLSMPKPAIVLKVDTAGLPEEAWCAPILTLGDVVTIGTFERLTLNSEASHRLHPQALASRHMN